MEKKYYSDKNNFVSVEATCVELIILERYPDIYIIEVENMIYEKTENCQFIGVMFEINEANSSILREANIEEKLKNGSTFSFISAPEYFGDGYKCPIVAIEIDGEILLDFNTGYENLMKMY